MPDPEALARIEIDRQLEAAGWVVQDRDRLNPFAGPDIAVREVSIPGAGEADYLLLAGRKAVGIVEAKPDGTTCTKVQQPDLTTLVNRQRAEFSRQVVLRSAPNAPGEVIEWL